LTCGTKSGDIDRDKRIQKRINYSNNKIDECYDRYYTNLKYLSEESQDKCSCCLSKAESNLMDVNSAINDKTTTSREALEKMAKVHEYLGHVETELNRAEVGKKSYKVVGVLVLIMALSILVAYYFKIFDIASSVEDLNKHLVLGVPLPVWIYALLGSLTSMLYRAEKMPFRDINEGMSWILHRSIVGIVMGVMTYLMLITGLIVFAGQETTIQVPQLVWVLAFLGGFSDSLSMELLQKISGKISPSEDKKTESGGETTGKSPDKPKTADKQTATKQYKEATVQPDYEIKPAMKQQDQNYLSLAKDVIEPIDKAGVEKVLSQSKNGPSQEEVAPNQASTHSS